VPNVLFDVAVHTGTAMNVGSSDNNRDKVSVHEDEEENDLEDEEEEEEEQLEDEFLVSDDDELEDPAAAAAVALRDMERELSIVAVPPKVVPHEENILEASSSPAFHILDTVCTHAFFLTIHLLLLAAASNCLLIYYVNL